MCGVFGISVDRARRRAARATSASSRSSTAARSRPGSPSPSAAGSRPCATWASSPQVFDEETLQSLPGEVAIGHTRYSTTGGAFWTNAQPIVQHGRARTVALGHNGNLTNTADLREHLAAQGVRLGSTSDTEVIAALLAHDEAPLAEAVASTMRLLEGAYSVVAIADGRLVAFRDPHGFRPLSSAGSATTG